MPPRKRRKTYMPVWWNGRHKGLKIPRWQQRTGSSPVTGTTSKQHCKVISRRRRRPVDRQCCFSFPALNPLRCASSRFFSLSSFSKSNPLRWDLIWEGCHQDWPGVTDGMARHTVSFLGSYSFFPLPQPFTRSRFLPQMRGRGDSFVVSASCFFAGSFRYSPLV